MSEWQAELTGRERDLEILLDLSRSSSYHITEEAGDRRRFYLTLPGYPPDADSAINWNTATNLVETINGAAKLLYDAFQGVHFTKITRVDDDGKRRSHVNWTLEPRSLALTAHNPDSPLPREWVELGSENDSVATVLKLCGTLEHTWQNLYLIYEVIEEDLGGERPLIDSGLIARSKIKLFKGTANSFRAIGREARHFNLNEPPKSPMPLSQARELTRDLVKTWIDRKQN